MAWYLARHGISLILRIARRSVLWRNQNSQKDCMQSFFSDMQKVMFPVSEAIFLMMQGDSIGIDCVMKCR